LHLMLQEYFLYFIAIVIKKEAGWAMPSFGIDMTEPRSLNSLCVCTFSQLLLPLLSVNQCVILGDRYKKSKIFIKRTALYFF
jgi:hypothetical protein